MGILKNMCILYVDIYIYIYIRIYIYIQLYTYMSGGQDYLLPAMDMAKVDGPLSVVNVFAQVWTSHVHSPLL